MDRTTLADTLRLLRDCATLDDSALALLVRRTDRRSRLGRAARAVARRRANTAPIDLGALLGADFRLGA